jgi:hypothetical protein
LPHSGLVARISTVFWRDWTNSESRPWIAPDLPVSLSSEDYFAGRDPAMNKILKFPLPTSFGELLENGVSAGADINTIVRLFYQRKTDAQWADEQTQQPMQRLGEVLLSKGSYPAALAVFEMNGSIDPKTLTPAIDSVTTAQKVHPNDPGLSELLKSLRAFRERIAKTD